VALLIAVPLGTLSALRPRSVVDRVATVLSQIGISVPEFWMAIVLILVFAGTLGWLPSGGYVPLTEDPGGWAQRLLMPAVVTGVVSGSVITRFVRSSVLEALGADHVRTAQAKGLATRQVFTWHVLRNALLPLVTVTGVQLAYLCPGWSWWRSSSPGRASGSSPCRRSSPVTTRSSRGRSCCSPSSSC
jgi:peptide/nickel transport system permease protein